jgi:hypothetical protein
MSAISRPNGDVDALRRHRGAEWLEADAAGIDPVVDAEVAAGIAVCLDEADLQLNLLAGTYRHRVGDAVAGKVLGDLHGAGHRGCAAHFTLQQKPAVHAFDADPLVWQYRAQGFLDAGRIERHFDIDDAHQFVFRALYSDRLVRPIWRPST